MNVTYIIGNGFDLNLGLRTSYKNFYTYYIKQHPSIHDEDKVKGNEKEMEIVKLKESIENYLQDENGNKVNTKDANWANLELALGQYTDKIKGGAEVMVTVYHDLVEKLKKHLRKVSRSISYIKMPLGSASSITKDLLLDLGNPEKYLTNNEQAELKRFYADIGVDAEDLSTKMEINIINLNYTPALERLLGAKDTETPSVNDVSASIPWDCFLKNTEKALVKRIYYLHHTLKPNDVIIVGVNDEKQIKNEHFRRNRILRELLIKPEANKNQGTGIDKDCKELIERTDLFVFFGISLGETDSNWWKLIGRKLADKKARLILFEYRESFDQRLIGNIKDEVKERISKYHLSNREKELIKEHTFVSIFSSKSDKHMFCALKNFFKQKRTKSTHRSPL